MEKRYFTVKEVATYLGLSPHTLRAWVKLGKIPFYKFGRSVRFDLNKVDFWLRNKIVLPVEDFHGQTDKTVL